MAVALHFNAIYGSHGYSVIHLEEKKPTEFKPFSQSIPKTREEACKVFRQCFSSYSPAVVKSIFLDYDKMTETPPWLMMMKEVGREVGYYCVHNRTRVSKILTEMLLDGKKDKKYLTGEKVLMIKYFIKRAEIELHLLEKKKIGWQVIDGKSVVFGFIPEKQRLLGLIQKLKVTIDEIKHVYIARWEYLELKQVLD
uniref:Uncharacterized protein n=1 Tax=Panagrolaimus sp. JU765 TaxID=591449 RepID=A0AC34RSS6_9BILA